MLGFFLGNVTYLFSPRLKQHKAAYPCGHTYKLNLMLIILYIIKLTINVINANLNVNYKYSVQVADKFEVTRQSMSQRRIYEPVKQL